MRLYLSLDSQGAVEKPEVASNKATKPNPSFLFILSATKKGFQDCQI